jgi:nicotinate-nucleotide adenylyltransferase
MKLGLFGGSFDPVHLGHLLVAQAAREELGLTRLYFVLASQSPFKPDRQPTPANERLRLLRLALAGQSWCEIDEQEIKRGGISYTIDTVRDYGARFPEARLFYLIGADHVSQLPKWRDADDLARRVEFVVIPRPGQTEISPAAADPDAGAGNQAAAAQLPAPFRGRLLSGFPLGVSSSQIRARVKAGLAIDFLVPRPVAEAIRENRLYF